MARKTGSSRLTGRETRTGQFTPVRESRERPATVARERIPLPGHGDKRGNDVHVSSHSGRSEGTRSVLHSAKGETVVVYRDTNSGRYTTEKSAERMRDTAERADASLRRLAKK